MRTIDIIMAKRFGKGKKGMVIGWPWMMGTAGGGGTETTVTGVSPLLLAAALKKPIKSLTQYGLCTQADTPTPAAHVDIMCNNGALTMVDDELPAGYKRLTGISFDGNTWYETGEALTGADDVTMTLDSTASQGQNVFGSYNGTSSGSKNFSLFIYGNGSSTSSYFRYGEQLLRPRFGTGERTITFGKSGTDGFASDATATPDTFTTPANAYIGMLPNSTSPAYTGDIKGNITVGTRLKWIPCERESDNAIGYYEAVKGVFIAPSGTGTPTALGYDGSHYERRVVGTDEVISVGGKNLNGGTIDHKGYTSTGGESTSTTFAGTLFKIPCAEGQKFTVSWGGITIGDNAWIQVEYGDTATEYQPYVTPQTATAPDLFAVGDYADEVEIISGGVKRKVGIKVLTGEETFGKSSAYGAAFYIQSAAGSWGAQKARVMCSHYLGLDPATSTTAVDTCFFNSSGHFYFRVEDNSDATAFKAWLAEQYAQGTPVVVMFALATETTESVTPQALHTNAGDNTISVEANVSPIELEAVYMKGA